jgi:hypothetical protein
MLKSVWYNGPKLLVLAIVVLVVVVDSHAGSGNVSSSTRKVLPRHSAKCTLSIMGGGPKAFHCAVQHNGK